MANAYLGMSLFVKRSLEGYFSLSKVAVKTGPLLRRASLTSLCKLSLPRWGTNDSSCLLWDHNVAALDISSTLYSLSLATTNIKLVFRMMHVNDTSSQVV
jgi:hypothetical protein